MVVIVSSLTQLACGTQFSQIVSSPAPQHAHECIQVRERVERNDGQRNNKFAGHDVPKMGTHKEYDRINAEEI